MKQGKKKSAKIDYGFLTGEEIKKLSKELFLENYAEEYVMSTNYDLRVGKKVFVSTHDRPIDLEKRGSVIINSGETAILQSYEKIRIPNDFIAFIGLRFSQKIKGLVNISGFQVNPGWEDYLLFSVYNAGPNPIIFKYRDPVFMAMFYRLSSVSKPSKETVTGELQSEWMERLKGPAISLPGLSRRLDRLETSIMILITLIVSIIAIAIAGWIL